MERLIDSRQCTDCARLYIIKQQRICTAYPDGIPLDMFMGYRIHDENTKDDRGMKRVPLDSIEEMEKVLAE
jgi:hypothetical protein